MSGEANRIVMVAAALFVLVMCGPSAAQWTEPVPVTEINTQYNEMHPFLSYDGLTLYFERDAGGTFRIYAATRDEPWGAFSPPAPALGAGYHVMSPWVSPDNLRMYYHSESSGWPMRISTRASVGDPWPAGAIIAELTALGSTGAPALTPDELIIVFDAPPGTGGQGGWDMWMASRPDRNSPFGNIRNLSELNGSFDDCRPFLSPDGLTLYFHSLRNGTGQIFRATRQSLSEPFNNIEHLSVFDTPGGTCGHAAVSSDGKALYFSRALAGQDGDIWVSYLAVRKVWVDIKPGSCPNPLNLESRGVLSVAVLGSKDFNVTSIDLASLRLEGIAPIRSSFEDVATPVADANECACTSAGPDGYIDLVLKFKTEQIAERIINSVDDVNGGDQFILTLTGTLYDQTPIEGEDCVVIVGKVPRPLAARKADISGDGIVNIRDLGVLARFWLETAATY